MKSGRTALSAALYSVLTAIARFCLRHGFPFDAFAELAKRAFVEVAHREFRIPGRKQSASRVSLLTGVHRKEVGRMLEGEGPAGGELERVAYSAAVVSGWRRDKKFHDARGKPASLSFDEDSPSFTDLVRRYGGGDVPPRAVLDELTRVGAVSSLRDGRLRLQATAYVPATTSAESLAIFGTDVADLVSAIDDNLREDSPRRFFQRKVAYDNLPAEAVDEILSRIERDGQATLEKLDRSIARRDRDANPNVQGTGRHRAMVGIYCFAEELGTAQDRDKDKEESEG